MRTAIALSAMLVACTRPAPVSAPPPRPVLARLGCVVVAGPEVVRAGSLDAAIERRIVERMLAELGDGVAQDDFESKRSKVARRVLEVAGEPAWAAWLARARTRWEGVSIRRSGGRCEEMWPGVGADAIAFEGNASLAALPLRLALRHARYACRLEPRLREAEEEIDLAYADRGWVRARVATKVVHGRFTLVVREGERYRTGRVRVLELRGDGSRRALDAAMRDLSFEADGFFSRAATARSIHELRRRLLARDITVEITPEAHLTDGRVDLDLVLDGSGPESRLPRSGP